MLIAKQYKEYPEVSRWMDERRLYRQLNEDTVFRNSNVALITFYHQMHNDIIGLENNADDRLSDLLASMNSLDRSLYDKFMADAIETNSNIVDGRTQDNNEETINAIYLKMIQYGTDSLNDDDRSTIEAFAKQCPYIGGTAVYKARSLYAMYAHASMFDDIKICNPVGVYKTNPTSGSNNSNKGLFDDENNYLKSIKINPEKVLVSNNQLLIYPNPTNSQINVRYKETRDTKLQIVNMLGVVVKEVFLSKDVQHVLTDIDNLTPNVYIYRQIDNERILYTGKLIIIN